MERDLWVAWLNVSERTAEKIQHLHRLTEDEVRDAVVCTENLTYTWDDDPERGLRAIVETHIRSRKVLIVLYPADDSFEDEYNLGSAYPVNS
ncbi:hypothetical protein ACFFMN_34070 [Planobispora siamensis]|uniref:Uncharacterized protein n=1 Tax=Planobispora siamensis TaxID=936338 RepID=A0A8J3SEN1_9ACTN|nr:hypothetical protein [Planobispora siamensis]GIH91919.1 hypothetical protein Psi01_25490 [Planobispora siamensis]